jgi:hypothetical protein
VCETINQNGHCLLIVISGLTLDFVVVHGQRVFKAGQLGVGVGRVRSRDGLRLLNFSSAKCPKHPPEVDQFYDRSTIEIKADLTCCRTSGMSRVTAL